MLIYHISEVKGILSLKILGGRNINMKNMITVLEKVLAIISSVIMIGKAIVTIQENVNGLRLIGKEEEDT